MKCTKGEKIIFLVNDLFHPWLFLLLFKLPNLQFVTKGSLKPTHVQSKTYPCSKHPRSSKQPQASKHPRANKEKTESSKV